MLDWLSYGLSDFLLFSPRAYWRLFELHNAAWWPLPLMTLVAGLVVLAVMLLRPRGHVCWSAAILAVLWAWVAWSFLWQRYAEINWASRYAAPVFALQAVLLLAAAWRDPPIGDPRSARNLCCLTLMGVAVILYPVLALLSDRAWAGAEMFGMAPDPTALATLGFALLPRGRWTLALLPIPLLWGVVSGVTLWELAGR